VLGQGVSPSVRRLYCTLANYSGVPYSCQDAGLHPLRQAAKKERMIDEHRSVCAEQYISYRQTVSHEASLQDLILEDAYVTNKTSKQNLQ
jgi:hypothetical protein